MSHPHAAGLDIVGAGRTVPLADGDRIEYANLDHGASAPALRVVRDTVDALLERYAWVHRGAGWHSSVCTSLYEGAREPVRRFVGGRADDAVIFTRHTTDAFNLLAHCLPARTTVVVFETEHHAALLPWQRTAPRHPADRARAPRPRRSPRSTTRCGSGPPGPALLVITGASNVTGELWPVAGLAAVARARGARVALDAAQLAPHRPFSITDLGVDYVALSGHKLYAPYGAGALIGRADWLAAAPPYLIGGGATAYGHRRGDHVQAAARPARGRHAERARRGRAGHRLPRAGRRRPGTAGPGRGQALTDRLHGGLADIPGVTVHSLFGGAVDAIGVVTFTIAGQSSAVVAAALSAEHGIGVRDGAFCAQPLVRRLLGAAGCSSADGTGHALRASVGLGTTSEHVERLIAAVADIAERGPRRRYIDRERASGAGGGRPGAADDRPLAVAPGPLLTPPPRTSD